MNLLLLVSHIAVTKDMMIKCDQSRKRVEIHSPPDIVVFDRDSINVVMGGGETFFEQLRLFNVA